MRNLFVVFVRRCDGFPGEGYSHVTLPLDCPDVPTALADWLESEQHGKSRYITRYENLGPVE